MNTAELRNLSKNVLYRWRKISSMKLKNVMKRKNYIRKKKRKRNIKYSHLTYLYIYNLKFYYMSKARHKRGGYWMALAICLIQNTHCLAYGGLNLHLMENRQGICSRQFPFRAAKNVLSHTCWIIIFPLSIWKNDRRRHPVFVIRKRTPRGCKFPGWCFIYSYVQYAITIKIRISSIHVIFFLS